MQVDSDPHSTKIIAEVTLVWVLFADARRITIRGACDKTSGTTPRLLAIGLPLMIALGAAAAATF